MHLIIFQRALDYLIQVFPDMPIIDDDFKVNYIIIVFNLINYYVLAIKRTSNYSLYTLLCQQGCI